MPAIRTTNQNRHLWALVGRLVRDQGLQRDDAEELLRDDVESVTGQRSTRDLSAAQAAAIIARMEERLRGRSAPARQPVPPPGPARRATQPPTPQQLEALDQIRATLALTPQGYQRFCARMLRGHPWPQTLAEAVKVHEGLEAMLQRRHPPERMRRLAESISQQPVVSPEDRAFAESIVAACRRGKALSAAQIGIALKIGRRYGCHQPERQRAVDPAGDLQPEG